MLLVARSVGAERDGGWLECLQKFALALSGFRFGGRVLMDGWALSLSGVKIGDRE